MRAWLLPSFSSIHSITLQDVADPAPAAGEVLLNVKFAALNPADRYLAEGQYPGKPTFPHILGRDAVGTVEAVGPNVTDVAVGETYLIQRGDAGVTRWGTFAEKVVVHAEVLTPLPAGWTEPESAGAALVYVTAYQALTQFSDLPANAVILISGASGGVGVAAIQLAKALGHTVIALSRGTEKHAVLTQLGADIVLDPQDSHWKQNLKIALPTRKVDLAIDNIAGPLFQEIIDTLANNGRISCVGRLAGPVPNFNTATLFFRRIQIRGVAISGYSPAESQAVWQQIIARLAKTNARPLVDDIFPFEQLPEAFARLKVGPIGKVLLRVSG